MADAQDAKATAPKAPGSPVPILAVIMIAGCVGSAFLTANMMSSKVLSAIPGTEAYDEAEKAHAKAVKAGEKGKEGKTAASEEKMLFKVGEYIVNLANRESTRYLKTDVTIEYLPMHEAKAGAKKEKKEEKKAEGGEGEGGHSPFAGKEAQVNDLVIQSLSSFTSQDLVGAEGKKMLKEKLMETMNAENFGIQVTNVYFNSFMIQ